MGIKTGTSHITIFRYLDGEAEPTEQWIRAAAQLLHVPFAWLLAGIGSMDE